MGLQEVMRNRAERVFRGVGEALIGQDTACCPLVYVLCGCSYGLGLLFCCLVGRGTEAR